MDEDKQSLSPEEQIKDEIRPTHQYDLLRYYWNHLNREEAIEKLKNSPNGSFLVRDSSTEDGYVLVLRDRGTTNNIKIFCKNGKYGFAEPFTFNSVADVINHYSEESLHKHSHVLDTKLLYPFCLNINEMVEIHGITETDSLHYFIHLSRYYQHQRKCLDNEFDNIMKLSQEINLSVTLLDALKQTIEIFNEQLKTLQDNSEAIDAADTESISKINGCLRNRIEDVEKKVYKRFEIYNNDKKLYEKAGENLGCKKIVCKGLQQHIKHLRRYIQNLKLVSENFLSVVVDDDRDGDVLHRNPQFWLMKGKTKEQADEILADKPRGTFLVRYSKGDVRYILSVMCDEEVKHFDIFYSAIHQSYGLTTNTCLFKSLTELITKYRRISLAEHFKGGDNCQHYIEVASLRNVETRKSSISELHYYWEDITREEANEKFLDAVDGSFLVRDSSTEGEYTLVLRKNGTNKCIKILHQEGKYGFVEPCTFNSISEIVDYFSKNSLEQYNPALDIKLLYPICNNNDELAVSYEDMERSMHSLVEINTSLLDLVQSFERAKTKLDYVHGEMKRSHLTIYALDEMRRMFQEQQKLIEYNQNKIKADDLECISNNNVRLTSRLNEIEQSLQEQYIVIQDYTNQYHQLTADICNKKLEIKRSNQLRNNIRRRVINLGISDNYVDGLLEEEKDEDIPHYDTRLWLLQKDRTQANTLLENKPHGSFLVRPKDANIPYILSVKCVDKVEHCLIYFNKNKRTYGFTKEFCFFKTLTDLVIKYRRISLVTHNENVNVNLIYPALSVH